MRSVGHLGLGGTTGRTSKVVARRSACRLANVLTRPWGPRFVPACMKPASACGGVEAFWRAQKGAWVTASLTEIVGRVERDPH